MIILTISFFLLLLIYFSIEYTLLRTSLKKIPLRILVNGTRGKSTTTKIIYEILQQEKYKVFAKTTGEIPIQYLPNGTNKQISRSSPASIVENIRLLRKWAQESPDSVVMECMALQSETQAVLSNKIFQPSHILITNIAEDHAEVMGQDEKEIARTIFYCFRQKAKIFIDENLFNSYYALEGLPNLHRIQLTESFPESIDHIPPIILNQNWNLIKYFTQHIKLDPQIVYRCFIDEWCKISDSIYLSLPDLNISIWNLFPVNDIQSSNLFVQHSRNDLPQNSQIIILLNTRKDRSLRTKQFAEFLKKEFSQSNIWLTGSDRKLAMNLLIRKGIDKKFIFLKSEKVILEELKEGYLVPTTIYCMGNYKGMDHFVSSIRQLEIPDQRSQMLL
jgi:poly-gamma-glutamate synthase PgsB/CapB